MSHHFQQLQDSLTSRRHGIGIVAFHKIWEDRELDNYEMQLRNMKYSSFEIPRKIKNGLLAIWFLVFFKPNRLQLRHVFVSSNSVTSKLAFFWTASCPYQEKTKSCTTEVPTTI